MADNLSLVLTPTVALPPAPTDLQAAPGDGEVGLSWSTPAGDGLSPVTGYTVLHRGSTGSATTSASLSGPATSYAVTGLTNGDTYEFAVEAVSVAGAGPATAWTSATPAANAPPLSAERAEGGGAGDGRLMTPWAPWARSSSPG